MSNLTNVFLERGAQYSTSVDRKILMFRIVHNCERLFFYEKKYKISKHTNTIEYLLGGIRIRLLHLFLANDGILEGANS